MLTTKATTKSSHFGWSLTGRSTASFAPLKYSFSKIGRDYKLKNQLLLVKSVSPPSSPEKEDGRVLRKLSLRDRAEQRLRICIDGRGLGSNLVSFSKGFSKHPHILAIIKVDSKYLRFSFKLKVDYFILY